MASCIAYLAGLATLPLGWLIVEFFRQASDLWSSVDLYYEDTDNIGDLTWFGRCALRVMRKMRGRGT